MVHATHLAHAAHVMTRHGRLIQRRSSAMLAVIHALVLGMGVGTLLAGPLSDAFGRRPVILFGAALIAFGEWVRHRWGDDPDKATAYLPSVFSGAGIVAMANAGADIRAEMATAAKINFMRAPIEGFKYNQTVI